MQEKKKSKRENDRMLKNHSKSTPFFVGCACVCAARTCARACWERPAVAVWWDKYCTESPPARDEVSLVDLNYRPEYPHPQGVLSKEGSFSVRNLAHWSLKTDQKNLARVMLTYNKINLNYCKLLRNFFLLQTNKIPSDSLASPQYPSFLILFLPPSLRSFIAPSVHLAFLLL